MARTRTQHSAAIEVVSYTDIALQYCEDVLSGKILACKQIKQACQRHLDDLDRIDKDPDYKYTYSIEKAERVCKFVSRLPHVAGRWAVAKNNRFKLQPWQAFFLTTLFGWVEKATGYRRFREALLTVPRKNGKSFLASAICLYCFLCDGEPGSQCFAAANSLEQAMTVWRPASQMLQRLDSLRTTFEVEVNAKSLVTSDGSRFVPLVGTARDGQSAHLAVLDEFHEAKEDSLYLSLSQSMGARTQPLMLVTTTAGVTLEGPCHSLQRECEQVLEGSLDRPELFALIYTIDKETDWTSEDALVMANPNLGVSVGLDALKTEHQNAIRNATKQNAFKVKKLNIWCNAATAFFNMTEWTDGADSKLTPDMFIGKPCWMAADLSSKLDITAVVTIFKDANTFYCFPKLYLPRERAEDPSLGMYAKWVMQGHLTATDGNTIDLEQILEDTIADIERFKPQSFAFDKWGADLYVQSIGKRCPRVELVDVPMETRFISPAMLELEALIHAKRFKHNNNGCMNWMISNVIAFTDRKGNVFPRKAKAELKIDGPVSLMLAVSRAMSQKQTQEPFVPFFV